MSDYVKYFETDDGIKKVYDEDGRQIIDSNFNTLQSEIDVINSKIKGYNNSPIIAYDSENFNNKNRLYVYLGNESGYSYGYIYYFDDETDTWVRGWNFSPNLVFNSLLNSESEAINSIKANAINSGAYLSLLKDVDNLDISNGTAINSFTTERINLNNGRISGTATPLFALSGNLTSIDNNDIVYVSCSDNSYLISVASYEATTGGFLNNSPFKNYGLGSKRTRVIVTKQDYSDITTEDINYINNNNVISYKIIPKQQFNTPLYTSTNATPIMNEVVNGNLSDRGNYYYANNRVVLSKKPIPLPPNFAIECASNDEQYRFYLRIYSKNGDTFSQISSVTWQSYTQIYVNTTNETLFFMYILDNSGNVCDPSIINHFSFKLIRDYYNTLPFINIKDFTDTGYFNADGNVIDSEKYNLSIYTGKYFECAEGETLSIYYHAQSYIGNPRHPFCRFVYYNSERELISIDNPRTTRFEMNTQFNLVSMSKVPEGASYVRLNISGYQLDDCVVFKDTISIPNTIYNYDISETRKHYEASNSLRCLSHRGLSAQSLGENTISAFQLSRKNGFDWIETDVRFTSDDVPVILHDATIDRTSNGIGNIADLTFAEVRQFVFNTGTGETIPTLEEFFRFIKYTGMYVQLEMKINLTSEQWDIITNLIEKYALYEYIEFSTFNNLFINNFPLMKSFIINKMKSKNFYVYNLTEIPEDDAINIIPSYNYTTVISAPSIVSNLKEYQVYTLDQSQPLYDLPPNVTSIITNSFPLGILLKNKYISDTVLPLPTSI